MRQNMQYARKLYTMKWVLLAFCIQLSLIDGIAQQIKVVYQGNAADSSFYHFAKMDANSFWAGGEYGILSVMDSNGVLESVRYTNDTVNILELERYEDFIYIATDNAVIYRHNLKTGNTEKKWFKKFDNRCFYDMMIQPDGKLLVCGGHTGIADGLKRIPHGFIAEIDFDTEEISWQWRSIRKFGWSMAKNQHGELYVSTFNGLNSKVKRWNNKRWKNYGKVQGLVHEIAFFEQELWFSGARSIQFAKDGIIGKFENDRATSILCKGNGCIWSMDYCGPMGGVIAVSQKGELIKPDVKRNNIKSTKILSAYTLYDIEQISKHKWALMGHGKGAYTIQFD